MLARRSPRAGFTLVELLVVIGILVLLASFTLVAFNANRGGDRIRSASRTAQSAFLSARDRAIQSKDLRGLRLIVNSNDKICTGFQYIRPLPALSDRVTTLDSSSLVLVVGLTSQSGALVAPLTPPNSKWLTYQDRGFFGPNVARVRIPGTSTGNWFRAKYSTNAQTSQNVFVKQSTLKIGNNSFDVESIFFEGNLDAEALREDVYNRRTRVDSVPATLDGQMVDFFIADGQTTFDLVFGNETLPMTEPINLPSGVVIDTQFSEVPGYKAIANVSNAGVEADSQTTLYDFLFTPRGSIEGSVGARGAMYFLISDLEDALAVDPNDPTLPLDPIHPKNKGEKLVLAIFPSSGNVQIFPIDPTDVRNNNTPSDNTPDGRADDLFRFARLASAAN